MAAEIDQTRISGSTAGCRAVNHDRPRVVLIEDNPLTVWAIERTLSAAYDVVRCASLEEARAELARGDVCVVICGSPIADEHPKAVRQFAEIAGRPVLALMADPDRCVKGFLHLWVLEKPFRLARLAELLPIVLTSASTSPRPGMPAPSSKSAANPGGSTTMATLTERLYARFEQEICPVCIHRTADGGCSLTERRECPMFEWARQLAELVEGIDSDRLSDYMDRIQAIVCPGCMQRPDGQCAARDHLDCPLDLYLGLVVPIIEEELKRSKQKE